ncbi:MAG: c-type cytochrome, partial [Verrucomicrobiales bacterium]
RFRRATQLDENLGRLAEYLKLTAPVALRDQLREYLPRPPSTVAMPAVTVEQRQALDRLISDRVATFKASEASGELDPTSGAEIFSQNCAACHQVGGEGGLIGPQLDGIGARGVDRIAEDLLAPNRNVDSHFYLTHFKLRDATELAAFVLSERGQSLQVRDMLGNSHRLKLSDISSRETIATSLMPATFATVIGADDFANLLAWLSATR